MREIIRSFQAQCQLTGLERARLLQKLVSASIAYASPCPIGQPSDGLEFYRTVCLPAALHVISDVNELTVIDTQQALTDTNTLYLARFMTLNSPSIDTGKCKFAEGMTNTGFDYSIHYNYWITKFLTAVVVDIAEHQQSL